MRASQPSRRSESFASAVSAMPIAQRGGLRSLFVVASSDGAPSTFSTRSRMAAGSTASSCCWRWESKKGWSSSSPYSPRNHTPTCVRETCDWSRCRNRNSLCVYA